MVRPDAPLAAKSYWIVVADEYQSRFFTRATKKSPLDELSSIRNESARKKTGELISDRGGRSFDSHGQGRHTMAREKIDPKTHAAMAFAKNIAEQISDAKQAGQFDRLVVIAAPRFLGVLRDSLHTAGVDIERTIDKEVTAKDEAFIRNLLDAS
jgi:protein required for attachment to host cells